MLYGFRKLRIDILLPILERVWWMKDKYIFQREALHMKTEIQEPMIDRPQYVPFLNGIMIAQLFKYYNPHPESVVSMVTDTEADPTERKKQETPYLRSKMKGILLHEYPTPLFVQH